MQIIKKHTSRWMFSTEVSPLVSRPQWGQWINLLFNEADFWLVQSPRVSTKVLIPIIVDLQFSFFRVSKINKTLETETSVLNNTRLL